MVTNSDLEEQPSKLPLSETSFSALRHNHMIYVDKTELIYKLASTRYKYFFSRPRRFGKTLLLSTFEALFKSGVKEFTDLAIAKNWTDPKIYPVLKLDFSQCCIFADADDFLLQFEYMFIDACIKAGLDHPQKIAANEPFISVIRRMFSALKDGSIVLLIDEYDAPLNNCMNKPELFEAVQRILSQFYLMLKGASSCFRFLFITGITRYKSTGIFSAFNIDQDISTDPTFGTLLGYTDEEITTYFASFITRASKILKLDEATCLARIKENYDGYCFDEEASSNVHCVWSVLNFLNAPQRGFINYWYSSSGRPSVLLQYLKAHSLKSLREYGQDQIVTLETLNSSSDLTHLDDRAMLCQTGYLTIKNRISLENVLLNYPNKEVSQSMARLYADKISNAVTRNDLYLAFNKANVEEIVTSINSLLLGIPYDAYPLNNEASVRALLLVCLNACGIEAKAETHNAFRRSDLEIKTDERYFVIELKYAKAHDDDCKLLTQAILQIKERKYGEHQKQKHACLHLALVFSEKERCINQYQSF